MNDALRLTRAKLADCSCEYLLTDYFVDFLKRSNLSADEFRLLNADLKGNDALIKALNDEPQLLDTWKGVKYELSLKKSADFLKNLLKAKKSNLSTHLVGEINLKTQKAVGCHIISAVDNSRVRFFKIFDRYSNGEIYKAQIEILDNNGNWIRKGGVSTFFDASYDVDKAIEKAAAIISNPSNKIDDRVYKYAGFDGKTIVIELKGSLGSLDFSTMYLEPL